MHILVTGTDTQLATPLIRALAENHQVSTVAGPALADRHIAGDLREEGIAEKAVQGIDVIVHLRPLSPELQEVPGGEALDKGLRGMYMLFHAAVAAGVKRVVQASTLDLLGAYPAKAKVNETYAPLPDTSVGQLSAYLAECSARHFAMETDLPVILLRTGAWVRSLDEPHPVAATAIRMEDAVRAFVAAVEAPAEDVDRWSFHHILGRDDPFFVPGRRLPFTYEPAHEAPPVLRVRETDTVRHVTARGWRRQRTESPWPGLVTGKGGEDDTPRVVFFGAGGPLLAAAAEVMREDHILRATDARPLAEAAKHPQSPHAPVPSPVRPPHEEWLVDVTDPEQVRAACVGMDVVVNGSVVRHEVAPAFRVNLSGCYNVLAAAVAEGIRRVVHTGPQLVLGFSPWSYGADVEVPSDAPARPGTGIYGHTKFLSYELCRVFAEEHPLTIPTLAFNGLMTPRKDGGPSRDVGPFTISWRDAGRGVRQAARVPDQRLPTPYSFYLLMSDLPHGRFHNDDARRYLGWEPQDLLTEHWMRE